MCINKTYITPSTGNRNALPNARTMACRTPTRMICNAARMGETVVSGACCKIGTLEPYISTRLARDALLKCLPSPPSTLAAHLVGGCRHNRHLAYSMEVYNVRTIDVSRSRTSNCSVHSHKLLSSPSIVVHKPYTTINRACQQLHVNLSLSVRDLNHGENYSWNETYFIECCHGLVGAPYLHLIVGSLRVFATFFWTLHYIHLYQYLAKASKSF